MKNARLGKIGGWASIGMNLFLFLLKGGLGILSGSIALIADAFHSLSDLVTSLVVLISFHISEKPSDSEHPFGHERAEFISAVIMSTLLGVTAVELGRSSIARILHPEPFQASWWIIGVLAITVLLKEALAMFSQHLSRKIHSVTLQADAWHHHMDAISTVLVILSFLLVHFRFPNLDGIVGLLIAVIIFYTAIELARAPINELLGSAPDPELLKQIESIALSFPQVHGVHDIIVHRYGDTMIISLDIEVDETMSLVEAHEVAEQVQQKLRGALNAYITVHYDPVRRNVRYREVEAKIRQFCHRESSCQSFHDLHIIGEGENWSLSFDLVIRTGLGSESVDQVVEKCREFLKHSFPGLQEVEIHPEPSFTITPGGNRTPIS